MDGQPDQGMATQAPLPGGAPGAGAGGGDVISVSKQKLDTMLQQLMTRASQSKSSLQQPQQRYSQGQLQKGQYDMSSSKSGPEGKGQEIGKAIGNFGTLIHNLSAQHKQNQTRDAMVEWQGISNAYAKAQLLAGSPPDGNPEDPAYKQKVMQAMMQDPWVKANLDPANPKAVKRLKNMSKALNFDPMGGDEENVHRQGLLQHLKVQDALKKVVGARQKLDAHQQQPNPQQLKDVLGRIMGQTQTTPPDPKEQLEVAKLQIEKYKADAEAQAKVQAQKEQDDRLDKRIADADMRQDKALQASDERQDKALLAHTQLMRDEMRHADERMFARMDTMGQTKGYNINAAGKAQKMNLKQGQDVPDSWISEKDAETISTPTGQGRNRAETAGVILKMNDELSKILSLDDKKLGALQGRINDFKVNKIGTQDPDYIYLSQLSELAKSATAMMHLGQRGAASTIATGRKFLEGYDTGKMPVANIRAGIKAVTALARDYVEEGSVAPIGSPEWNKRYKEATHDMADDSDLEQYRDK